MSDMTLGTFDSLETLHALLRTRIEAMQITRLQLDELAGLPGGYSSKLFSPKPLKKLGRLSLPLILGALNIKLFAVVDEAAAAEARITMRTRKASAVRVQPVHQIVHTRRSLQKWGRLGGAASRSHMSAREASRLGKLAANARWSSR
jgi:hypothetical protein